MLSSCNKYYSVKIINFLYNFISFRFLIFIIFFSLLSYWLFANPCDNILMLKDTLIINTGYNYSTLLAYNTSEIDPNWILTDSPDLKITTPCAAFTLTKYKDWINPQKNSQWISAYDTTESGFTNDPPLKPFTIMKYFCSPKMMDSIRLDLSIVADNDAKIYLDSFFVGQVNAYSGSPKKMIINLPISEGSHSLKIELRNFKGAATGNPMGVNLIGEIIGHYSFHIIKLIAPDTSANAGSSGFKIPIVVIKEFGSYKPISFFCDFKFDKSAFIPDFTSDNPHIIKDLIINNDRILTLKFDNLVFADRDSLVFYISGLVLLADSNTSNLTFSGFNCTDANLSFDKVDGKLRIEACAFDLRHIQMFNPPEFKTHYDFKSDNYYITASGGSEGRCSLELYNIEGDKTESFVWMNSENFRREFQLSSNHPVGVYMIVFKSEWNLIAKPLLIIK